MLEDEARIPELVGKFSELELLEMESKPVSFVQLAVQISANCRKFRGLKMAGAIKKEDAMAIVEHLPKIKSLDLSRAYLPKEQLMVILDGCREIERLSVNECIGFETGNEEVMKKAKGIKMFENRGSKLEDDFDYETDDCDPWHVCIL